MTPMFSPSPAPSRLRRSLTAALLAAAAPIAHAQTPPVALTPAEGAPAVLLEPSLEMRLGRVLSLDERIIVFIDDRARRREVRAGDLLAILPRAAAIDTTEVNAGGSIVIRTLDLDSEFEPVQIEPAQEEAPLRPGLLQLTDNQRYRGDLTQPQSGASEDQLAWRHDTFGQLAFPFDRVRQFRRPSVDGSAAPTSAPAPSQDTLLLANGDMLRGFLSGLADPARFETDNGVVDVDFRLVSGADLANPPAPVTGMRVWLADGSVVHAFALELSPRSSLSITLSDGQKGEFDWESVRAVLFDAARLVPLAAAPIRSQSPLGDRRFAPPIERVLPDGAAGGSPALDAWDLIAPGPMAVEFDLPPGAARLATRLELVDPRSPWGDCEVVLAVDNREVLRRRLSAEESGADVVVDLAGAAVLKLSIEPGKYGPIRDRVALRRPLILVAP